MLLRVQGLNFSYGYDFVLKDINFSVDKNEIVAVVGPNGSGKTTLSYCLSGVIPHLIRGNIGGGVFVSGKNILSESLENITDEVGYIFQDPENQFVTLRVRDELEMAIPSKNNNAQFIIDTFQINNILDKSPSELSMGQKQRVALVSTLLRRPRLLILDEPGSTIDPCGTKQLSLILKKLSNEATIVLFTHDIELAHNVADRIIGISEGQIKFDKSSASVSDQDYFNLYQLEKLKAQKNIDIYQQNHKPEKLFAQNISFRFLRSENFAVKNLSLEINDNWGIAGLNGSGKTTLLLLLAGLIKPTSGAIHFDSVFINKMTVRERLSEIGVIFQNPNHQIFAPTIYEELSFGLKNFGIKKDELSKRIDEIADLFELGDLNRDPHTLSFGWRKILTLACVFAIQPHFIFFDEPELGLDLYFKQKFESITDIAYKNGLRLILASHNLKLLQKFSKNISFLENGKLKWVLSTNEAVPKIKQYYEL